MIMLSQKKNQQNDRFASCYKELVNLNELLKLNAISKQWGSKIFESIQNEYPEFLITNKRR